MQHPLAGIIGIILESIANSMSIETRISSLEAAIADYRGMLENATSKEEKNRLLDLITVTVQTVNLLIQQQPGKVIDSLIDSHSRVTI